jgi:hypothetical protein
MERSRVALHSSGTLNLVGLRCGVVVVLLCLGVGCGSPYGGMANLDSAGMGIVCLGDSITRGAGATRGNDYVSRLSSMLGMEVVHAGVNGDTTERALWRLEEDVLSYGPRLVVIELGGNDFFAEGAEGGYVSEFGCDRFGVCGFGCDGGVGACEVGFVVGPVLGWNEGHRESAWCLLAEAGAEEYLGESCADVGSGASE